MAELPEREARAQFVQLCWHHEPSMWMPVAAESTSDGVAAVLDRRLAAVRPRLNRDVETPVTTQNSLKHPYMCSTQIGNALNRGVAAKLGVACTRGTRDVEGA